MNSDLNKKIFDKIKKFNLPLGKYAIFGSGPLGVRGFIKLKDLDILSTSEFFEELRKNQNWQVKKSFYGDECISFENLEFFKNWSPGDWDVAGLIKNAQIINGLPFVQMEQVLKWKKIRNNEKDKKHIKIIEKYFNNNNSPIKVNDKIFNRYPIKTHLITQNDKLEDVVKEYAMPHYKPGDILVMSERMVAITQGRLIHQDEIKEIWLAKFLIKFVKKWPNDPGFRNAKKMQLVINTVGVPRVLLAALVSAITKSMGIRGLFYKICGQGISEIDGFAPGTIPPYDKYAVLGPENPNKVCNDLARAFGIQCAIVDANNIDVAILGTSDNIKITREELRLAFLDNPIGQGLEQTPICIIREEK